MSNKKRVKRELSQETEYAEEHLEYLSQKANRFFETATPFEISCELSRRGVITAHREGIFELLDADFQRLDMKRLHTLSECRSVRFLAMAWRRHIESKGREPSDDDLVFLMVASLHVSIKWSESRVAITTARLEDIKAELSRRENPVAH